MVAGMCRGARSSGGPGLGSDPQMWSFPFCLGCPSPSLSLDGLTSPSFPGAQCGTRRRGLPFSVFSFPGSKSEPPGSCRTG